MVSSGDNRLISAHVKHIIIQQDKYKLLPVTPGHFVVHLESPRYYTAFIFLFLSNSGLIWREQIN